MTHEREIASGHIVDIFARRIFPGKLIIETGNVVAIEELQEDQVAAGFLLPGFVDSHIHIESSLLAPPAFARIAVCHGTVAAVCDPHEIANVLGSDGVEYMLEQAERSPFHFFFGVPSCVPATNFETSGAVLGAQEVAELLADRRVTHLAEVMNFPGVIGGDPVVLAKIDTAKRAGLPIDGHAPGLSGEPLRTYTSYGITTDHECSTLQEAREKSALGQKILFREGSAAKNFSALLPLLFDTPGVCMFCSDDLHPDDLLVGHINLLVKRAVAANVDLFSTLQAACVNPVQHYRLPVGMLRPGDPADFIRVRDLRSFDVQETWLRGRCVYQSGTCLIAQTDVPLRNRFAAEPIDASHLQVQAHPGKLRVIAAQDRQLLTDAIFVSPKMRDGLVESDIENDVLKLVVKSRYDQSPPKVAFVRGFGLKQGALASTVAHDSHNIIAVGADDDSLLRAINAVISTKGGLCVVTDREELVLPLPIAGLMSDREATEIGPLYSRLNQVARTCGCVLQAPLMTLSFLALLVIPSLKLSDRGLFDGQAFQFVDLFEST